MANKRGIGTTLSLLSLSLLCASGAKERGATMAAPQVPKPSPTPPVTAPPLRINHARSFSGLVTPADERCTEPEYLGSCIFGQARSFIDENFPNRGTCSAWCVDEERVEVAGRGQMVNTGPSTIWTHPMLRNDCSTQEGNQVFWTGKRCRGGSPRPDVRYRSRNNSSLPHVPKR